MSGKGTRATDELRRAGVSYATHEYALAERHGRERDERPAYGTEAAAALGVDPARIFKTLVARVDDHLAMAIVPVDAELDLKLLADALHARRASMAEPAEAEKATGYVVGGISPIGGRRRLAAALDTSAFAFPTVFVSGGRRGLQVELAGSDLARLIAAVVAPIARRREEKEGELPKVKIDLDKR